MSDRISLPRWIWFTLALLLGGGTGVGLMSLGDASSPTVWQEPATPPTAPNFALETLDGETFRLRDHRGEVVVLNFWATWCPPCRQEIPHFVTLQRDLGDRGLQFVGVALEREAGPESVRAFAEEMEINYPIGLGDGTIARKYGGVRSLPMTFIIGPEGTIRGSIPGMTTESRLRPGLERLLDEAAP